ncbi:MAG: HTH-type transcriptional activator AllS [Candidatus Celerinatantimonas neptuna]|nr:MAG: HTH-type transcriptional activator AllS [Candidatus Celerinatantimonas neptuna]
MFLSTLEQWALLRAVVAEGSIAKAAKRYHRSQPSVSYQLNQLQQRLGIELLELKGRQLVLTESGRDLLEQVQLLLDDWQNMEHRAASIKAGTRSVVSLVVDALFPKSRLFSALKRFNERYSHTQVHFKEVVRDEGVAEVECGTGDLYLVSVPEQMNWKQQFVMDMRMILVARSDHPVFSVGEAFRFQQLSNYPLIQIVDKVNQRANQYHPSYRESWYFTSVESAIQAVLHQLGYGWLPEYNIKPYLDDGRLRQFNDSRFSDHVTSLYLVKSDSARHDQTVDDLASELLRT